jgi:hypothetical protein
MPGAGLTGIDGGKAPSERPDLEPYRGKPAVRNLRGDDGNVGIIRSPVRAIVLPDLTSPRKIPDGDRVIKRQDPGRRLALAGERRASPARYGQTKATKCGRKDGRESEHCIVPTKRENSPQRIPWREGGAGSGDH